MMNEFEKDAEIAMRAKISTHCVPKGIPEAITYIAEGLHQAAIRWGIPHLNDIWVIQSNVVRPLSDLHDSDRDKRTLLGLTEDRSLIPEDFGRLEARAYEQLLQLSRADRMLIISIATANVQRVNRRKVPVSDQKWRTKADELGQSIIEVFKEKHHKSVHLVPTQLVDHPLKVHFKNQTGAIGIPQKM